MKIFATLLAFLFLVTASVLSAETNSLIIIGEGKKAVTDEMIGHIKQLAKSVYGKLMMCGC